MACLYRTSSGSCDFLSFEARRGSSGGLQRCSNKHDTQHTPKHGFRECISAASDMPKAVRSCLLIVQVSTLHGQQLSSI